MDRALEQSRSNVAAQIALARHMAVIKEYKRSNLFVDRFLALSPVPVIRFRLLCLKLSNLVQLSEPAQVKKPAQKPSGKKAKAGPKTKSRKKKPAGGFYAQVQPVYALALAAWEELTPKEKEFPLLKKDRDKLEEDRVAAVAKWA